MFDRLAGSLVSKLLCYVGRQVKHLVGYQGEVDNGKLTAEASFEKLTFRAWALPVQPSSKQNPTKGSRSKSQLFKNSLQRLISDCPTKSVLLNHPDFVGITPIFLKTPNPDQHAIGIGKIPILTSVLSSSNSQNTYYTYLLISSAELSKLNKSAVRLYSEEHGIYSRSTGLTGSQE